MIDKRPGKREHTVLVTFRYPADSYAESVHLVGDFNDWNNTSLPLDCCRSNASNWELTLELATDHSYQYRYLVNGNIWVNDSKADEFNYNPYGSTNSVVRT
ncbi:MAG: isoamylase early set domain-containing protein [Anaerolineae bacterium]